MSATIRFSAKLLENRITLPKSVSAKLRLQNMTEIEGVMYGLAFRASITPDSKNGHLIKIRTTLRDALNIHTSETVPVEITRVGDEIETRVPADLFKALSTLQRAKALWTDITPLARRDWIFWMISGKKEETRTIRLEKMINMLSSGKRRVCCFAGIHWL